jgi:hypothetical protein
MPDEPTKDYPPHGGEGKGAYGAGWPDNQQVTPNFGPTRFGPTELSPLPTDYGGEGNSDVHPPQDQSAADHFIHPFKLQRYIKKLSAKEIKEGVGGKGNQAKEGVRCLRVYYGELWSTISVIKTTGTSVTPSGGGSAVSIFGISSQLEIPGINRTVIPDFVNEDLDDVNNIRREVYRFVEWSESYAEASKGGKSDGNAYGIVLLTWHVSVDEDAVDGDGATIPLGTITEAYLEKVATADEIPEDQLIQTLAISGTNLQRAKDNIGKYSMVIGESRDLELEEDDPDNPGQTRLANEGKSPIDQQVYDHVYYATTLVTGSASASDPDDPWIDINIPWSGYSKPTNPALVLDPLQGLMPGDRVVINGNKNLQGEAQEQ